MIIEIKNFGPIGSLKFDLNKDLHLIYGNNAIGKSYATYCLYCLIKNIKNKFTNRYIYAEPYQKEYYGQYVKNKLKSVKVNEAIDCTNDTLKKIENGLKEVILEGLQNSLLNTFSSLSNLKNRYTNKNYELVIHISDLEEITIISDDEGMLDLTYNNRFFEKIQFLHKNTKTTKFSLYVNSKKELGTPNKEEFTIEYANYCLKKINEVLAKIHFQTGDIYYLPASRSGLYQALNTFTPILAELTQNRFFIKNKSIELPALSEPLADYFIDLSTIDKKKSNPDFEHIIQTLQDEILLGQVHYDDETKRILYRPKDVDLELNLSEASSMVAELSPLVLYFKHIINNKYASKKIRVSPWLADILDAKQEYDILFIEEPEAHLHPEVQVKLMEVFASLAKLGLKIFITSHSNYMFNKINNILLKNEISEDIMKVYHLVKSENGATIDGKMEVSPEGINDDNFQSIAEQLYNERLSLYE